MVINMKTYRVILEPLGPVATPFQSDTIFGNLVWMIKYILGDDEVENFLGKIISGEGVFAVSAGFTHDTLPLPFVPLSEESEKKLDSVFASAVKKLKAERKAEYYAAKFKKQAKETIRNIKIEDLQSYIPGKMDITEEEAELFIKCHNKDEKNKEIGNGDCKWEKNSDDGSVWSVSYRNIVNRFTGCTGIDGLFESGAEFFKEGTLKDIYVRTNMKSENEIKDLFEVLGKYGYGADSSIGRGQFKVIKVEEVTFRNDDGATYMLSLCSYCPIKGEADLSHSYYSVFIKRGKMGGDFAGGIPGYEKSFFKLPLILIKEGALINIKESKDVYGSLIRDVNKFESKIVQSGFTFGPMIKL